MYETRTTLVIGVCLGRLPSRTIVDPSVGDGTRTLVSVAPLFGTGYTQKCTCIIVQRINMYGSQLLKDYLFQCYLLFSVENGVILVD